MQIKNKLFVFTDVNKMKSVVETVPPSVLINHHDHCSSTSALHRTRNRRYRCFLNLTF